MRMNLNDALSWLETAADIISVVVPATRDVEKLLKPEKAEDDDTTK